MSLTHLDEQGAARMVDVGAKPTTPRRAVAHGRVRMSTEAITALLQGDSKKGDVLNTARVAGIMAAKRTPELIPLCHAIAISGVQVDFEIEAARGQVEVTATVDAHDRTGVEMEALTAVSVAALTIYDMLKAVDRGMEIGGIELLEKDGGLSGSWRRAVKVVPKSASAPAAPPLPTLSAPGSSTTPPPRPITAGPRAARPARPSRRPSIAHRAPAAVAARGEQVQRIAPDDGRLRTYLRTRPIDRAYMLGDLDPARAEHCTWWALPGQAPGLLDAVVLLYTGLRMPALITSGHSADVHAVLHAVQGELPRPFYAQLRTHHISAVEQVFRLGERKDVLRMGLTRDTYEPAGDPRGVRPIGHRDTGALMALYAHYPDNFFDPAQLDTGLYCGLWEGEQLVSVAGLHVLSEANDIAAIGNIVTHTDHRGRGLATRCVRGLLDQLLPRVGNVALNVDKDNAPAIHCYQKFGFTERFRFVEAWVNG